MRPRFPIIGAAKSPPQDDVLPGSPASCEDRACCCPAQPVVRVIMPTTPRRHSVDLLLCGHHYRVSRPALAAACARIEYLPGKAEAAEAALLRSAQLVHGELG